MYKEERRVRTYWKSTSIASDIARIVAQPKNDKEESDMKNLDFDPKLELMKSENLFKAEKLRFNSHSFNAKGFT